MRLRDGRLLGLAALVAAVLASACGDDAGTGGGGEVVEADTVMAPGPMPVGALEPRAAAGGEAGEGAGMGGDAGTRSGGVDERAGGGGSGTTGAGVAEIEPSRPAPVAEEDPSVSEVLGRAAAAYAGVRSMQADFAQISENPILRRTTTSRGTLYQRRPDRFLMRFSDPAGDLIVSDGEYIWIYYPSVNEDQVIRLPANSAGSAGAVDLQAQFVGDPTRRFETELLGREQVSGANAFVVMMRPRQAEGYRSLKVWIDPRDYLARRFEITEGNGVVRRFDLTGLRTGVALDDERFEFEVPEGTRVVARG